MTRKKSRFGRGNRCQSLKRRLCIEKCEDRLMLSATMADIVFLYDETGSGEELSIDS